MSSSKDLGLLVDKALDMIVQGAYEFRSLQVSSISREEVSLEHRIIQATFLVEVVMYNAYENEDNGYFVGVIKCENKNGSFNCFWKEKLKLDR
jgi:hypothetical protein